MPKCGDGAVAFDYRSTRTNGLQWSPVQRLLLTSCASGNEKRNCCAFQPMPMRCVRLNQGLPVEEFFELTLQPHKPPVYSTAPFYAKDTYEPRRVDWWGRIFSDSSRLARQAWPGP